MSQAFGIGLRKEHFQDFLPLSGEVIKFSEIDCLEIITENYFRTAGPPLEKLLKLRNDYNISSHGVSLSLASLNEIDLSYLADIKKFYHIIDPLQVSDHLCFTGLGHSNTHNLLPFVYNNENLQLIANRIDQIQHYLQREMVFENLSMYLNFKESTFSEAEFMGELHRKTGVKFLLDVNNIIVNKKNFHIDPNEYLNNLPKIAVKEIHLAGHSMFQTPSGSFAFDTHSTAIESATWSLYKKATALFPEALTIIERDENIPPLAELLNELQTAKMLTRPSQGGL